MVSAEDKRKAIDSILSSDGFRRADQLKRLVAYLIEQDEAGRSHEVTEYEIATRALGRGADFAPDTDSSVRARMHGLRQKLEEYYETAEPAPLLRIEFPKGAYRPSYRKLDTDPVAPAGRSGRWIAAAVVAVAIAAGYFYWSRPTPFDLLWQPVVSSKQAPVLLVAQPLHVWVRDVQGQAEPQQYVHFPDPVPTSESFKQYSRPRLSPDAKLVLHPSPNATLWGDAAGAASAARFLAFHGAHSEILPESTLKSEVALRGRPILAFGRPEFSAAVQRYLLAAGGFTVGMVNSIQHYAIYKPANPSERFLNTQGPNEVNYGLITVMHEGAGRVMVFSGITSDGSIAGIEYLTNPDLVDQLWGNLRKDGITSWPRVFQVVVRVESSAGYVMGSKYAGHLVLQK